MILVTPFIFEPIINSIFNQVQIVNGNNCRHYQQWYDPSVIKNNTLLRVIPTKAFNSSHLTFCLANLLGIRFGILFEILSGITSGILSGRSSDILFGILFGILYGFVSGLWGPVEVRRGPRRAESPVEVRRGPQCSESLQVPRPTALRLSPVEVRRGPQCSDSRWLRSGEAHSAQTLAGWGPARPTALRLSRLRSGEAHCDQELAEEVGRRPLRSRAGRWGPARKKEEEGRRRRSRATNIKSNNPHLAGGELYPVPRYNPEDWTTDILKALWTSYCHRLNHHFTIDGPCHRDTPDKSDGMFWSILKPENRNLWFVIISILKPRNQNLFFLHG